MTNFINWNGKVVKEEKPLFSLENRGFKYGDGLFESIRMFDGEIPFLSLHIDRLLKGMQLLGMIIPETFTSHFFEKEIKKITNSKDQRIRLSVYRTTGGLYTPSNNTVFFTIQSEALNSNKFVLNRNGLNLGAYKGNFIAASPLSNAKTCNALIYILAGNFCTKNKLDACLILNNKGRIAETNFANIFIKMGKTLLTPRLTEGCIDGTMRRIIFDLAAQTGLKVNKKNISVAMLKESEEIFLTNAIQGIRWVKMFKGKKYQNHTARHLNRLLNQKINNG